MLGLILLAGCDQAQRQASLDRQNLQMRKQELATVFQPCARDSTTTMGGILARSRCFMFTVAENPEDPSGRQLQLPVMIVPAIRPLPEADPLVIIVGGPGQAATTDGLAVVPLFEQIRQSRDILLVDQRGTGSASSLNCDFARDEDQDLQVASAELLLQIQTEFLGRCLDGLDADPLFYTTDIAVQDLEAIRQYLGYTRLNLWGVSYGTRVALNFLRYYPDSTRTVIIDGVAPPGVLPVEAARDGGKALQLVLDLCREESACAAAYPNLQEHYTVLLERYASAESVSVRLAMDEAPEMTEISSSTIQSTLFMMLYSRETARLIPLFIESMYVGNFQGLAGLSADNQDSVNIAMHYSVICSEDLPVSPTLTEQEMATLFAYDMLVQSRIKGCEVWPSKAMPEAFFQPVESEKPVLIFSATQDPVTPRRWGDMVARTLPNSLHLEAKGIGHGVFAYGCVPALMAEFVENGSVQGLDTSCMNALNTRPFFVSTGGSARADD